MKKILALSAIALAGCSGINKEASSEADMFGEMKIDDVVARMTLEQKVSLVLGRHRGFATPPDAAPGMPDRYEEQRRYMAEHADEIAEQNKQEKPTDDEVKVVTAFTEGRVAGAAADGYSIDELNIPVVIYADGPAGLRIDPTRKNDTTTYYCTAFPTGTILAASWDEELVKTQTRNLGNEVKEYGADILLAPAINIHRNPLCGRNFEYFSEDPLLSGKIAAAYVNGIQENGVGTSVKHYAANSQETMRNGIDSRVSERALREIYLKGFEIAVKESSPWTIMSSYNKVNGTLASENKWLLTDVLRNEWGFDGVVMTDWWAEQNGARQTAAGNDLLMPGTQRQHDEIIAAINDGTLDIALLDRNVKNILRMIAKTPAFKGYKYSNTPDLEGHAKVAREVATQGMVLLENKDQVLPLADKAKVALFGIASYDTNVGGSGSGYVNRKYKVNINEGLKNAGYTVDAALEAEYNKYIESEKSKFSTKEYFWIIPVVEEKAIAKATVDKAVKEADVAIVTIGRMAGEGGDRKLTKGDYYLSETEMANFNMVSEAAKKYGKKVIMLLNMGSIVDLNGVAENVDGLLHIWMPGQEAGNAVADVISGKVNPSGKLPLTWAKNYSDYSSANDFPLSEGEDGAVIYKEDIYVGYRHFDKKSIAPLYPFGFGLSYTEFGHQRIGVKNVNGEITVNIMVENKGNVAGKEIVQLYVAAPQSAFDKPVKELRAFGKTPILQPGETCEVVMHLRASDLASFDEATHSWKVDSGVYEFMSGASATDIRIKTTINL
ncbi:MAG: glycoside hydrolase family 3 C-terminal domain-containing protein [Bacteroidales bacterium]|nr:glycoside hydrolase family 3 C-terminal domain-containing protein [Bacteroidales bacterium]